MKKRILIALALISLAALAFKTTNSIDGDWTGNITGPENFNAIFNYSFKTENGKLTGTTQAKDKDEHDISEGMVKGDSLSFAVELDNGGKIIHTGKYYAAGDSISINFFFMGAKFHGTLKRGSDK